MTEAAAMFSKAMELAPGDFEIAFTAAGYFRCVMLNCHVLAMILLL